MTLPDVPPNATRQPANFSSTSPVENVESPKQPSQTVPLREAVKRGWDWVVFTWQMLRRMGGPIDLLLAFWTLIALLTKRLLVQIGLLKK